MSGEKSKIAKGMVDFYLRVKENLPKVESTKPFEVKVDLQQTQSVGFKPTTTPRMSEDDAQTTLAPPPPGITAVNPNVVTSAGGTTVTITGTNFAVDSTVKIANIPATSVTVVNSTTITCVTPADGIGFVNVEVTSPNGQPVSNNNLLQYTDFPDNFLLEGPHNVAGYQGCALGPDYSYRVTARLGTELFTPPAGVTVYAWIGVYQDAGSCGLEQPFSVIIDHNTGPTVVRSFGFAIRAVTPGSYGAASVLLAIWASRDGSIGSRFPTYGDVNYQPTAFRVDIAGNGPPPTGTGEFFSWSGTNPNSGHFNPFAWSADELIPNHPITIKRINAADGSVVTSYNGTATLTVVRDGSGSSTLNVSRPTTVTFVSGTVTFNVAASVIGVPHGSTIVYFHLVATEGSVVNSSPQCTAIP